MSMLLLLFLDDVGIAGSSAIGSELFDVVTLLFRVGREDTALPPLAPGIPDPSLSTPGIRLGRTCGSFDILESAGILELMLVASSGSMLAQDDDR